MSTFAELMQNIKGAAGDPQFWSDVGSNAANVASKPAQIMQGALPAIYSTAGSVKRRLGDVLTNPVLNAQRTMGQASDDLRAVDQLQQQAFADQSNPFRPTDKRALAELVDKYMNTAGGFAPIGLTVYHGSPHTFDKFDSSKIGTGEGAQAYGHGLYLAESPDVAKSYQKMGELTSIAGKQVSGGRTAAFDAPDGMSKTAMDVLGLNEWNVNKALNDLSKSYTEASTIGDKAYYMDLIRQIKQIRQGQIESTGGQLYKVDLPDEHIAKMLDWDLPLSQQHPDVQKALEPLGYSSKAQVDQYSDDLLAALHGDAIAPTGIRDPMGSDIARGNGLFDSQLQISKAKKLQELGIPGIKYLDQTSRNAGEGTRNFVVFPGNEDLLQILERNGQPIAKPAQYDASKVNAIADQLHGEVNQYNPDKVNAIAEQLKAELND